VDPLGKDLKNLKVENNSKPQNDLDQVDKAMEINARMDSYEKDKMLKYFIMQ